MLNTGTQPAISISDSGLDQPGEVARGPDSTCDRVAGWALASRISSIPWVRHAVGAQLADWGLHSLIADAELLVSEIVTNAVQHAEGPLRCTVWSAEGFLRCEVEDRTTASPRSRDACLNDEHGRGMKVLDAIACCWGIEGTPTGKIIWFELLAPSPMDL